MTTALTVPDFIKTRVGFVAQSMLATAASQGVGGMAQFPRISIKQSRWRLVDTDGTEDVLKTFEIQFGVIAINPAVSKSYYAMKYNPDSEPTNPDCFSHDGIKPDSSVANPVHHSCATCPMNVWGSATNPNTGKDLKACKDAKEMSLVFPNELAEDFEYEPNIYQFRMSAMSMINFSNFAKDITRAGISLDYVIVKASFDATASYPLVEFSVMRNMTEHEYNTITKLRDSDQAPLSVGIVKHEPALVERVAPQQAKTPVEPPKPVAAPTPPAPVAAAAPKRRGRPAKAVVAPVPDAHGITDVEFDDVPDLSSAPELDEDELEMQRARETMARMEAKRAAKLAAAAAPQRETIATAIEAEKVRQRSPVNVVNADPADAELEAALAAALR